MELTAKGRSGQISFDGKTVTITHEGLLAKTMHGFGSGSKSIPISSIGAVQFKPATSLTFGYIQLSVSGELAKGFHAGSLSGVARNKDISKDENSVLFAKNVTKDFEKIAEAIRAAVSSGGARDETSPVADPVEQIQKLAELRDAGYITQEEFDAKKAEILGRM